MKFIYTVYERYSRGNYSGPIGSFEDEAVALEVAKGLGERFLDNPKHRVCKTRVLSGVEAGKKAIERFDQARRRRMDRWDRR